MVKIKIDNIFNSECGTLVNTVNCVGVMGKGIALEFKKRYPQMYKEYVKKCEKNLVKPGVPYYYNDLLGNSIINFPTKDHWRSSSRIQYIVSGLDWIVNNYKKLGITSIALPPLGCGNGGLDWKQVGPIMYNKLKDLPIKIEIYAPFGTEQKYLKREFLERENIDQKDYVIKHSFNENWIPILETIKELGENQYAPYVGRTIFQKICYVITVLGVKTGFEFKPGFYGPFSTDVKKIISFFSNNNLIIEKEEGKMIRTLVTDEYKEFSKKYSDIINKYRKQIDLTTDLFSRIKNTEQAEIVVTVFYANNALKKDDKKIDETQIYEYIINWKKNWNNRDKKIAISSSIRNLNAMGLIDIESSEKLPYVNYFS